MITQCERRGEGEGRGERAYERNMESDEYSSMAKKNEMDAVVNLLSVDLHLVIGLKLHA